MVYKHADYSHVGVIPPYALLQRKQSMSGNSICVVAGDRGGLNALLPVFQLALENGCRVQAFFAGTCAKQYQESSLKLDERIQVTTGRGTFEDMESFFHKDGCNKFDLVLVAASQSKEGTELAENAVIQGRKPLVIGVEDMYGSMGPILSSSSLFFDRLCVIDDHAKALILAQYPGMESRIVVTGGPQFDKAVAVKSDWAERRSEIRKLLNARDNTLVFLLAGGVNGTKELLDIVDCGIITEGVEDQAKVILRMHPRSTAKDQILTETYLSDCSWPWHIGDAKNLVPDTDDLLPGADFVVSGFSTVNHLAILYEMPGVIYVSTPAFQKDLMEEKGLQRPPEVDAGAAWYAQKSLDIAHIIELVSRKRTMDPFDLHMSHSMQDIISIEDQQSVIARYNDGHAAERVWQEMCTLMN